MRFEPHFLKTFLLLSTGDMEDVLTKEKNKVRALAHSGACGGRLRHLPCTPQCASLAERFYILGKDFPNI